MRIVVTGREGQVARALLERGPAAGHEIVAVGRPELDLAGSAQTIFDAIARARPDVVVSAAAYTAVDKAESDERQAFAVNAQGPGAVASAARHLEVPLIHLSTDYVFSGNKASPYREDDPTGPTSVYGRSKLAGEEAALAAQPNCAVLRTAWVYSPFGNNFVKTMLRLAEDRDELNIVADQRGNPTSALDIADGIFAVAANLFKSNDLSLRGIFNMSASGEASWAEFAETILAESASLGGPSAEVRPIATADYPTPAKRPANSRLDGAKLQQIHRVRLPDWRESTRSVVQRLLQADA